MATARHRAAILSTYALQLSLKDLSVVPAWL